MRRSIWRFNLLAVMLLVTGTVFGQSPVTFTEYPGPTSPTFEDGNVLVDITSGGDGNLWFTEGYAFGAQTHIGKITPSGVTTLFPIPSGSSEGGIVLGSDGNLWFPEYRKGKIGRITPAGVIVEFSIPGSGNPYGITAGPDGNLWFTLPGANTIGKITTSGQFTMFSASSPIGITAGPDGNLWFTENVANKIGKITTLGIVSEFSIPTSGSNPFNITAGPDGNLWFTESTGNKIGRITTGGSITEFSIPTSGRFPTSITAGPDGNVWYTVDVGAQLGRITPSGVVTVFAAPTPSRLSGISKGPDGALWFLEATANKIVKATINSQSLPMSMLPTNGGNAGTITVQIFGNSFQNGATCKLTGFGPDIVGTKTEFSNTSIITTTFDLKGAAPGLRTLIVTNPDNTAATLPSAFTVEQGGASQPWVDIIGRDKIRSGSQQTYYLVYGNRGNIDAIVEHLWLSFPPAAVVTSEIIPSSVSETLANGDAVLGFDIFPVAAGSVGVIPLAIQDEPTSETSFNLKVWSNGQ